MNYKKEKITITLEDEDVDNFWDIIMFALDWNAQATQNNLSNRKDGSSKVMTTMSEDVKKLADKLEEISRPSYG